MISQKIKRKHVGFFLWVVLLLVGAAGCAQETAVLPPTPATTIAPTETPTLELMTPTVSSMPTATKTAVVTATPSPIATATPAIVLPAAQPGWTWHEDDAVPGIAFQLPEAWENWSIGSDRYQSSVSNSLIVIRATKLTNLGWRRWIQTQSLPDQQLADGFVEPNGVIKGRPAFLMTVESPGYYAAEFFISDGSRVIHFRYLHAGGIPFAEEAQMIQTMFETLQFASQNEGETNLSPAWTFGKTVTVFEPERLDFAGSPETISGTVEEWKAVNPGFPRQGMVVDSEGVSYEIDLEARYHPPGFEVQPNRDARLVELGQPVRITGYRQEERPNGLVRFYPIIIETTLTTGEPLVAYQTFFDLNRFAPELLTLYPTGAKLIVSGRWAQLADYVLLADDLDVDDFLPDDELIAVGTLQSVAPRLLQVTQLYRLDGRCKLYTTDIEQCQFYIPCLRQFAGGAGGNPITPFHFPHLTL